MTSAVFFSKSITPIEIIKKASDKHRLGDSLWDNQLVLFKMVKIEKKKERQWKLSQKKETGKM